MDSAYRGLLRLPKVVPPTEGCSTYRQNYFLAVKYKMSATGFSQVDTHSGFLICTAATDRFSAATKYDTITTTDVSATSGGADFLTGTILRDCGKFVTVVNSTGYHTAKYRLVSKVAASGSEGNSEGYFYVKVWDHAGSGVTVARLG